MTKDANQIAQEYARRNPPPPVSRATSQVYGNLTLWESVTGYSQPLLEQTGVTLDLGRPGLAITYDREGNASVVVLRKGWFIRFEPQMNHEGE